MLATHCQNFGIQGKTLGLHSTAFSEHNDGNTRLNRESYGKNAQNRLQLVKSG